MIAYDGSSMGRASFGSGGVLDWNLSYDAGDVSLGTLHVEITGSAVVP